MLRRIVSGLILAGLVLLAGCALLREALEPPAVTLDSLQITQASLQEQRYLVRLRVSNPNPVALPVSAFTYAVQLEGESFAEGKSQQAFTVPAGGETVVALSVSTNLLQTLQQLGGWLQQGPQALHYGLRGELQLENALLPRVPFEKQGEIQLTR